MFNTQSHVLCVAITVTETTDVFVFEQLLSKIQYIRCNKNTHFTTRKYSRRRP